MHDPEKADSGIVAVKLANKAGRPVTEAGDQGERGPATHAPGTVPGSRDPSAGPRTESRKAEEEGTVHRTSPPYHCRYTSDGILRASAQGCPSVDGMTWQDYEADLEPRLRELHKRVHRGAYRSQPSRRTHIPKADGKQRPLAIAVLEDKIVQGATVMVLNAIYEGDFVGFSYGFRPGRGPHDALDALTVAITTRKVNWILDADVQNFFGSVSQDWLVQFLEHRIGDRRIIRLIRKWLRAGILEDGVKTVDDRGKGQGSVISLLLANVHLHYCFDLWAERWRRQEAHGDMIIVRYADDLVTGFEHEDDARRFLDAMRERLEAFALTLHSDKTRLIEFGRHAATNRKTRGLGKPETFVARQSGWEHSDNQDGHFGGRGERMIVAARR
jgi:RNA-directed DNA polymerase